MRCSTRSCWAVPSAARPSRPGERWRKSSMPRPSIGPSTRFIRNSRQAIARRVRLSARRISSSPARAGRTQPRARSVPPRRLGRKVVSCSAPANRAVTPSAPAARQQFERVLIDYNPRGGSPAPRSAIGAADLLRPRRAALPGARTSAGSVACARPAPSAHSTGARRRERATRPMPRSRRGRSALWARAPSVRAIAERRTSSGSSRTAAAARPLSESCRRPSP